MRKSRSGARQPEADRAAVADAVELLLLRWGARLVEVQISADEIARTVGAPTGTVRRALRALQTAGRLRCVRRHRPGLPARWRLVEPERAADDPEAEARYVRLLQAKRRQLEAERQRKAAAEIGACLPGLARR